MKKTWMILTAMVVSVVGFLLLGWAFVSMKGIFVHQFRTPYITPTEKDSMYMDLLSDTEQRPRAIAISHETQPFYFWADSAYTILDADIAPDLVRGLLTGSGLSDSLHDALLRAERSTLLNPDRPILEDSLQSPSAWGRFLQGQSPQETRRYLEKQTRIMEAAERSALEKLR